MDSADDRVSSDSDVGAEALVGGLFLKRAAIAALAGAEENFGWSLRGGKWTLARKGVSFDCFLASSKSHAAAALCDQFGLARSGSFPIALYGEHEALLLGKSWPHRMEFLLHAWQGSDDPATFKLSADDISRYEDCAEMVELLASTKSAVVKRAQTVRSLGQAR